MFLTISPTYIFPKYWVGSDPTKNRTGSNRKRNRHPDKDQVGHLDVVSGPVPTLGIRLALLPAALHQHGGVELRDVNFLLRRFFFLFLK